MSSVRTSFFLTSSDGLAASIISLESLILPEIVSSSSYSFFILESNFLPPVEDAVVLDFFGAGLAFVDSSRLYMVT
jgi:hypothetical protein